MRASCQTESEGGCRRARQPHVLTRADFVTRTIAGALAATCPVARVAAAAQVPASSTPLDSSGAADASASDSASASAEPDVARSAVRDGRDGLRMLVATDMHFLSPRLTDHGACFERTIRASDAKCMEYSEQIMDALVWTILRERPDVVAVTGDLTYNGAVQSHEDFVAKMDPVRAAGIPVLVIPGNHDVNCPQAARFSGDGYEPVQSLSGEQFSQLYAAYGYDDAIARDDASLSYVWQVPDERLTAGVPVRFLFVDCNAVETPGTLPARTLAWVGDQLADARAAGAQVLAFSHQSVLQQAFIAESFSINNADDLRGLYDAAGVRMNFSGHLHCQHYATDGAGLTDVATESLAVSPNLYALVDVRPAEGAGLTLAYRTASLDVAGWARERGSDDPDLLDFPTYARDFFRSASGMTTVDDLVAAGRDEREAREMVDYITDVNQAWFAGRLDLLDVRPDLNDAWAQQSALVGLYLDYVFNQTPVRDENVVEARLDEAGAR